MESSRLVVNVHLEDVAAIRQWASVILRKGGVCLSCDESVVALTGRPADLRRLILALQDAEQMLAAALQDAGDPAGELCDVGGEPTAG